MKRDYFTGKHDDVIFFTGVEVEKTPAYDLDTLFVVGAQPISDILEQIEKGYTTHIYLGANQSFHIDISQNHQGEIKLWSDIIFKLLDKGYWVTLDYDIKYHNWVLDCNFNEHQKFISQISVKLPSIEKLNYNSPIVLPNPLTFDPDSQLYRNLPEARVTRSLVHLQLERGVQNHLGLN